MKTASLFDKANTLSATSAKVSKSKYAEHPILGIEEYAVIRHLISVLEVLLEGSKIEIVKKAYNMFIKKGIKEKKRPSNFIATDGTATAVCQLRKGSQALSEDDLAILIKNIPDLINSVTKRVITTHETFVINPAHANNKDLLDKVSNALMNIPEIPTDFILKQAENSKTVVADDALEVLFANGLTAKKLEALLPLLSIITLTPRLIDEKNAVAFDYVRKMLKMDEDSDDGDA